MNKKNFCLLLVLFSIFLNGQKLLIGKNGNKSDIAQGMLIKKQLFPDYKPLFRKTDKNIQTKIYSISSPEEIEDKMNITQEQFKKLGFPEMIASKEEKKNIIYIYEISIQQEVSDFPIDKNIIDSLDSSFHLSKLSWSQIVEEYGRYLVVRQETKSYLYLSFLGQGKEEILEERNARDIFFLYLQKATMQGDSTKIFQEKTCLYLARMKEIFDGISPNGLSVAAILGFLQNKDYEKIHFTNAVRQETTLQEIPALYGKTWDFYEIASILTKYPYKTRWYGGKANDHNSEKYTESDLKKIEIDIPSKKLVLSYPDYNKSFYRIEKVADGEIQGTWNGYYYTMHYYGAIKMKLSDNNKSFEGTWMDKEKSYKLLWIAIED